MSPEGASGEAIGWEIFKYLLPKAQKAFFCILQFLVQWTFTRFYSASGFLVLSSAVLIFLLLAYTSRVKTSTLLRLIVIVFVSLVLLSVATCCSSLFLLAIGLVTFAGVLQDSYGSFLELSTEATSVLRELRDELARSDLYQFVVNGVAVLKPTSTFSSADEVFSEPFPNKCVADEFSSRFWCTAHHILEPLGQGSLVSRLERASENLTGLAYRLHEVVVSHSQGPRSHVRDVREVEPIKFCDSCPNDSITSPTLHTSTYMYQGTLESLDTTRTADSLFRKSFSLVDFGPVFALGFMIFLVVASVTTRRRIVKIPRLLSKNKPVAICATDKLAVVSSLTASRGCIEQHMTSLAEDFPSDSSFNTALLVQASGCDLTLPIENPPTVILQNASKDVQTFCLSLEAKDIPENLALQSELPSKPDGSEDRPYTIVIDSPRSTTKYDVSTLDASAVTDNALAAIAKSVVVEVENLPVALQPPTTSCQTGFSSANDDESLHLCTVITNTFVRLKNLQQIQHVEIDNRLSPSPDSQWEISCVDISRMMQCQVMYETIVGSSNEILGEQNPFIMDGKRKRTRERIVTTIARCSDIPIKEILRRTLAQYDEIDNLVNERHRMKGCCLSHFRSLYKDFAYGLTAEKEKVVILRHGQSFGAGPRRRRQTLDGQHNRKTSLSESYPSSSVHFRSHSEGYSAGDTSPGPTAVVGRKDEITPFEFTEGSNEQNPVPNTPEPLDPRVRLSISNVKSGASRPRLHEDVGHSTPTAVMSPHTAVDLVESPTSREYRSELFRRRADYIAERLEKMNRCLNPLLSVEESTSGPAKEIDGDKSHEFNFHRRALSDGSALVNHAQSRITRRIDAGVLVGPGDAAEARNAVDPRSVSKPVECQPRDAKISDNCNDKESCSKFSTRTIDYKRSNGRIRATHRRAVSEYGRVDSAVIPNRQSRRYPSCSADRASAVGGRHARGPTTLASEGTKLISHEPEDDQNRETASSDPQRIPVTHQTNNVGATSSETKTSVNSFRQLTGDRSRVRQHRTTSFRRTTAWSSGRHVYDITEEQSGTSIAAAHVEKQPQIIRDPEISVGNEMHQSQELAKPTLRERIRQRRSCVSTITSSSRRDRQVFGPLMNTQRSGTADEPLAVDSEGHRVTAGSTRRTLRGATTLGIENENLAVLPRSEDVGRRGRKCFPSKNSLSPKTKERVLAPDAPSRSVDNRKRTTQPSIESGSVRRACSKLPEITSIGGEDITEASIPQVSEDHVSLPSLPPVPSFPLIEVASKSLRFVRPKGYFASPTSSADESSMPSRSPVLPPCLTHQSSRIVSPSPSRMSRSQYLLPSAPYEGSLNRTTSFSSMSPPRPTSHTRHPRRESESVIEEFESTDLSVTLEKADVSCLLTDIHFDDLPPASPCSFKEREDEHNSDDSIANLSLFRVEPLLSSPSLVRKAEEDSQFEADDIELQSLRFGYPDMKEPNTTLSFALSCRSCSTPPPRRTTSARYNNAIL